MTFHLHLTCMRHLLGLQEIMSTELIEDKWTFLKQQVNFKRCWAQKTTGINEGTDKKFTAWKKNWLTCFLSARKPNLVQSITNHWSNWYLMKSDLWTPCNGMFLLTMLMVGFLSFNFRILIIIDDTTQLTRWLRAKHINGHILINGTHHSQVNGHI